jgi:hypothetical protein
MTSLAELLFSGLNRKCSRHDTDTDCIAAVAATVVAATVESLAMAAVVVEASAFACGSHSVEHTVYVLISYCRPQYSHEIYRTLY